jgi:N-acetyl-gamma-glutamyl-phosphate reductase/acetylglutamate kinase
LNTFPARPPSLLYRLPHCKKELFTDSGAGTLIRRGCEAKGRIERSYLPVGPSTPHRPGTSTPSATRALSTMARRAFSTRIPGSSCGCATAASTECKVALIGAHGYTGQALTTLLSGHRYLNLDAVNRGAYECKGRVDSFMALPNVDLGAKERTKESVIVDLSADYRFEHGWTYGLLGEA